MQNSFHHITRAHRLVGGVESLEDSLVPVNRILMQIAVQSREEGQLHLFFGRQMSVAPVVMWITIPRTPGIAYV